MLVTNNELNYQAAANSNQGRTSRRPRVRGGGRVRVGLTSPRVTAAVTGMRPDGKPAEGDVPRRPGYRGGLRRERRVLPARLPRTRRDRARLALRRDPPAAVAAGRRDRRARGAGSGQVRSVMPASRPTPCCSTRRVCQASSRHWRSGRHRPRLRRGRLGEAFSLACTETSRRRVEPVQLYRDYLETMRGATR